MCRPIVGRNLPEHVRLLTRANGDGPRPLTRSFELCATYLWTFKEGSSSAGPLDLPRGLYLPDPKALSRVAPVKILARSAREKPAWLRQRA